MAITGLVPLAGAVGAVAVTAGRQLLQGPRFLDVLRSQASPAAAPPDPEAAQREIAELLQRAESTLRRKLDETGFRDESPLRLELDADGRPRLLSLAVDRPPVDAALAAPELRTVLRQLARELQEVHPGPWRLSLTEQGLALSRRR